MSIGISDSAMVTNLLIFVQPGLNDEGRYISAIKDDPASCLAFTVVAEYLICASYYLFLGQCFLVTSGTKAFSRPDGRPTVRPEATPSVQGVHVPSRYLKGKPLAVVLSFIPSKVISLCWLLALLPTIPLWTDTTIKDDMAMGCTCYYPLNNVTHF